MSEARKTAGVKNFERRTWDRSEYAKRAAEKALKDNEEIAAKARGIKVPEVYPEAPSGVKRVPGSKRGFIKERKVVPMHIDRKIGKTEEVTATTNTKHGGGFWCDICECLLKDSMAYLDHINGRKHQRRQGLSMRVEKSSATSVRERMRRHKLQQHAAAAERDRPKVDEDDVRMAALLAEEEARRRKQRADRKRRRGAAGQGQTEAGGVAAVKREGEGDGPGGGNSGGGDAGAWGTVGAVKAEGEGGAAAEGAARKRRSRFDAPAPGAVDTGGDDVELEDGTAGDAADPDSAEPAAAAPAAEPAPAPTGPAGMLGFGGFGGSRKNR